MYKWLGYSFLFIGLLILIILGLVYWLKDNINRNVMYAFLGFGIGFFILGGIILLVGGYIKEKDNKIIEKDEEEKDEEEEDNKEKEEKDNKEKEEILEKIKNKENEIIELIKNKIKEINNNNTNKRHEIKQFEEKERNKNKLENLKIELESKLNINHGKETKETRLLRIDIEIRENRYIDNYIGDIPSLNIDIESNEKKIYFLDNIANTIEKQKQTKPTLSSNINDIKRFYNNLDNTLNNINNNDFVTNIEPFLTY